MVGVKIRYKKRRYFFFTVASILVDLLSCCLLLREAYRSCLSDDSDFDLTWISHFCLNLF